MITVLRNIKENNALERIWLLAKIEFKLRYYENKIGLLWALIRPLTEMLVYYVAFNYILNRGIDNYISFLYLGIITWSFFIECTTGMITVLKSKKYLYEYSNMSKIEIYIAHLLSISLGFIFNLLIFVTYYLLAGNTMDANLLWYPLVFLSLFLFGFGLSIIISNLFIMAKDIKQIWGLFSMMLFWLSPIIFEPAMFETRVPFLKYLNPMFGIISNTRECLMYGNPPNWNMLLLNLGQASVAVIIGAVLLRTIGKKASEIL